MNKARAQIKVYCEPELKSLIEAKAHLALQDVNQYIVAAMARIVGKRNLAVVPRNKRGRPKKEAAPVKK